MSSNGRGFSLFNWVIAFIIFIFALAVVKFIFALATKIIMFCMFGVLALMSVGFIAKQLEGKK